MPRFNSEILPPLPPTTKKVEAVQYNLPFRALVFTYRLLFNLSQEELSRTSEVYLIKDTSIELSKVPSPSQGEIIKLYHALHLEPSHLLDYAKKETDDGT